MEDEYSLWKAPEKRKETVGKQDVLRFDSSTAEQKGMAEAMPFHYSIFSVPLW